MSAKVVEGSCEDEMIHIDELVIKYGDFVAVDGISLDIQTKGIYGFLGPNGAGKTTTMRALTTLLKPTSGSITIQGLDAIKDMQEIRKRIGMVQQYISLD